MNAHRHDLMFPCGPLLSFSNLRLLSGNVSLWKAHWKNSSESRTKTKYENIIKLKMIMNLEARLWLGTLHDLAAFARYWISFCLPLPLSFVRYKTIIFNGEGPSLELNKENVSRQFKQSWLSHERSVYKSSHSTACTRCQTKNRSPFTNPRTSPQKRPSFVTVWAQHTIGCVSMIGVSLWCDYFHCVLMMLHLCWDRKSKDRLCWECEMQQEIKTAVFPKRSRVSAKRKFSN